MSDSMKGMKRKKRLFLNTVSSFLFQLTTIICGFVLPRLILQQYGSEVNGLVNSITQFLQIIAFLELGVGAVVQSSLYKPLSDDNYRKVSEIISSASKFFKNIAIILLFYVALLMIAYPYMAKQNFGWIYTATLIAAMSISSFTQYYFGVVDRLLLTADQHGYIQYTAQTATLIINTIACAVFIKLGATIHIVKLTTSLIYVTRPLILRLYVNKNYKINRKIKYEGEPIQQKWNGVAQHVAAIVLDSTDTIVLTLFSTLTNVSIYGVYHLVIYGIKQLFTSMVNGMQSLIGELWAKKELSTLNSTFERFEWIVHTATVFIFGCTGMLVVPFVQVYTCNVHDANYIQPLFAALITIAHAGHCLRMPYNTMILAGGHYKQTQNYYIISAAVNIVVSAIAVAKCGLIGVAIGTICGTFYHTVCVAFYISYNLIKWPFRRFIRRIVIDLISAGLGIVLTYKFSMISVGYFAWFVLACKVAIVWFAVVVIVNLLVDRKILLSLVMPIFRH